MKFIPRPYQEEIIDWQNSKHRQGTWCFMGGGKTVSTLTTIQSKLDAGKLSSPALILAPLRVAQSTWPSEVEKWDHLGLTVQPIVGDMRARQLALSKTADVYTTNYENIPWLVEQGRKFDLIVADEATKLKSFRLRQGGKRAAALGKIAHSGCSQFWALTGLPAPNGLMDMWGQTWFLDKGCALGRTFTAFRDRWFHRHYSEFGFIPRQNADKEILAKIQHLYLSLKAEDYFDVSNVVHSVLPVSLPNRARRAYDEMERHMLTNVNGKTIGAVSAADRTIKALQAANGAIYSEDGWERLHDEKLMILERLIADWQGESVLVAYHFKHDAERILKSIKGARLLDKDPKTIEDWNKGKIPVLLAHPQSAGHGLNLQYGGRVLVFFGHWWSLEDRSQIIERIGPVRQIQVGFNRTVHIYDIVAEDTVDESVLERHKTKREINDILMDLKRRRE